MKISNIINNNNLSNSEKIKLEELISKLDSKDRESLLNYLTELSDQNTNSSQLNILFGTESGNSENLAELTLNKAKDLGIDARLINMADTNASSLEEMTNLLVLISTWGEGEPPESAEEFYNQLMNNDALNLKNLNYGVLALGDTSYELFCQTGKDLDTRLEKLGAKRLIKRVDCDVDFDEDYNKWSEEAFKALSSLSISRNKLLNGNDKVINEISYSRKNPYESLLKEKINLNATGSSKQTMHLEFDLKNSGLKYNVGDSLAVQPENPDELIEKILDQLKLDPETTIAIKDDKYLLKNALKTQLDITTLSIPFLKRYNEIANNKKLKKLIEDPDNTPLKEYMYGRDILDVFTDFPALKIEPQPFVDLLRKLPPRLYSISSSQKAHPNSVHLTVGVVRYNTNNRDRIGICSTFLSDRIELDSAAKIFVTPNKNFKLPQNSDAPIIMVGPGTGIAPFRAFLQERKSIKAKGKNWLFFGDQHFLFDFLYQSEWQAYQKEGILTKIDLAFSRDQKEKVYVQDKMRDSSKELFNWIDSGAYFYVCGDASRMAKDVDIALHEIISKEAAISSEEAVEYVKNLKKEKRYLRDVY